MRAGQKDCWRRQFTGNDMLFFLSAIELCLSATAPPSSAYLKAMLWHTFHWVELGTGSWEMEKNRGQQSVPWPIQSGGTSKSKQRAAQVTLEAGQHERHAGA